MNSAIAEFFLIPLSPVLALAAGAVVILALEAAPWAALRKLSFPVALLGTAASFGLTLWTAWALHG